MTINTYLSIITSNVSVLNNPKKKKREMSGLLARNTQTQRRPKPHLYAAYKKNRKKSSLQS